MIILKICVTLIAIILLNLNNVLVGKAIEKTGKNNFTPYQECVICAIALVTLLVVVLGIAILWLG